MRRRRPVNALASAKAKLALEAEFTRRQAFCALLRQRHPELPQPTFEHQFALPDRKWSLDMVWITHKLALESEGGVWTRGRHTRGAGFIADCEKYNEAAIRDWVVLRVPSSELATDPTCDLVKRALLAIISHGA